MPSDLVTGTPTFDVLIASSGTSGSYVLRLTALNIVDGTTAATAAGTATTTGALTMGATIDVIELENITYPLSVAAGDWQRILLSRIPTNASDTLAAPVNAIPGAELVYTADM